MASDNVERAKRIMARYPEVFQSLEDYDRTRKLPKLYRRKRLDITIDENVLRDFREHCMKHSLNMSRLIETKMLEELKAHRE
jgi:hypothetical protein